jgi:hypothetical protein
LLASTIGYSQTEPKQLAGTLSDSDIARASWNEALDAGRFHSFPPRALEEIRSQVGKQVQFRGYVVATKINSEGKVRGCRNDMTFIHTCTNPKDFQEVIVLKMPLELRTPGVLVQVAGIISAYDEKNHNYRITAKAVEILKKHERTKRN